MSIKKIERSLYEKSKRGFCIRFGKILRALEENGSPKPEFETDADHSYFISRLFVHEVFLKEEEPGHSQKGAKKEPKRSQKGVKKGAESGQGIDTIFAVFTVESDGSCCFFVLNYLKVP